MSARKPSPRLFLGPLILLCLFLPGAPAVASPAGAGVRPDIEGEGPPALTSPGNQRSVISVPVQLNGTGGEIVTLKSEGLPEGLKATRVSLTEWEVTGTPTEAGPAKTVTVLAENAGGKETAKVEFEWTVAGLNSPGAQTAVLESELTPIALTGEELNALAAVKALPPGIELKKVSENEWQLIGTPTQVGPAEIELSAENGAHESLGEIKFTLTVEGIENPGPQSATVGSPVTIPLAGAGLHLLNAKALPAGLELEKVSETRWQLTGTPTHAGQSKLEIQGEDAAAQKLPAIEFTITVAEAQAPPISPAPSGTLAVSPAAAFSAARSSCGGVTFSTGTVATQWLLDGAPIAGATSATYTAPRIDDGHLLSCRETATAPDGLSAQATSAGAVVHEQPPQPAWPIGPASEHCAAPVCMEDASSAQTPPTRSYQQGGSWLTASQVRCVSAPWTSIAGNSTLAAVEGFAEAHTVTVTLERVTSAGVATVASAQLSGLGASADGLDGSLAGSPFAGQIVTGYGAEAFTAGELWPHVEPGSLGKPDRFAAGQGYLAYQLAATPGVRRSFQLLYNLTAADLGARLRCVVTAEDGAGVAPTSATLASPEYAVAKSSSCAPRMIAHIGGPQPAVVTVGSRRCLSAQAGLSEIGGALPDVSSVAGRSVVALDCALAKGCSGRLVLASAGKPLASAVVSLRAGARRAVSLKLGGQGPRRLRRAGGAGLPVTLTLKGHGSNRLLLAGRLLNLT